MLKIRVFGYLHALILFMYLIGLRSLLFNTHSFFEFSSFTIPVIIIYFGVGSYISLNPQLFDAMRKYRLFEINFLSLYITEAVLYFYEPSSSYSFQLVIWPFFLILLPLVLLVNNPFLTPFLIGIALGFFYTSRFNPTLVFNDDTLYPESKRKRNEKGWDYVLTDPKNQKKNE